MGALEIAAITDHGPFTVGSTLFDGFDSKKKQLFLELYAKSPNLTAAAQAIGHSPQLIHYHFERDPEFKKAFDAVRQGLCDQLEGKVYEYGQRPQNFMDRIAYLRAYRPDRWNPQAQITVQHNVDVTAKLSTRAHEVIDTTAERDDSK